LDGRCEVFDCARVRIGEGHVQDIDPFQHLEYLGIFCARAGQHKRTHTRREEGARAQRLEESRGLVRRMKDEGMVKVRESDAVEGAGDEERRGAASCLLCA
jgi:hypothetical protein